MDNIQREYACGIIPFYRKSLGEYVFFLGRTPDSRGESFWKFPKGHKDSEEEEDVDAARRELREETALDLKEAAIITSTSFSEQYFFERGDEVVRKMNTYFLGQVDRDMLSAARLDEQEFIEYRWVSFDEAISLMPENSHQMLIDANDFLVRHRV